MSKLREKGNYTFAFDSTETLKAFLSIDGQCLGTTKKKTRCGRSLKRNLSLDKIGGDLNRVHEGGFPSDDAAKGLRALAEKCICNSHTTGWTWPGAKARSQKDDKYDEWSRSLWAECLLASNVRNHADTPPPALDDVKKWRERIEILASGLPASDNSQSPTTFGPSARSSLKATRTGSWAPEPLKRTGSGLKRLFVSRSRAIGRMSILLSRSAAPARSTTKSHGGLPRAPSTGRGSAERLHQQRPVQREPDSEDYEEAVFYDAVEEPAETGRREYPVHRRPKNGDGKKSGVMDAPAQIKARLTTPAKSPSSTDSVNNGIQRLLEGPVDASPSESFVSIAPSPTFSVGESNHNETPDTLYSHSDPMSAAGKLTSRSDIGRPDQKSATVASPAPTPHVQETLTPSPHDPHIFNPPRQSTAPRTRDFVPLSRIDPFPAGESSVLEFRHGPRRQARKDVPPEHDSPTKSKSPAILSVSRYPDIDEGGSEEDKSEEDESEEDESEEDESEEDESEEKDGGDREGEKVQHKELEYKKEMSEVSSHDSDFELYRKNGDTMQFQALKHILEVLERRTHDEQRPGYIYIFQRKCAEGFLKIGRSKEAFGRRPKQIGRKCGYEVREVGHWYMDVAVKAIETCVHCHLDECRHWDMRCDRLYEEKRKGMVESGEGTPKKKGSPCTTKHKEWFKVGETRATEVVKLWHDFMQTRPFENGHLNCYWRKEVDLVWDNMKTWKREPRPALQRWEKVMRDAVNRHKAAGNGHPMADLGLRLRVWPGAVGSTVEIIDNGRYISAVHPNDFEAEAESRGASVRFGGNRDSLS